MNLRKQIDLTNKRLQSSGQIENSQASCDYTVKDSSVEQDNEQLVKAAASEVGTECPVKDAQIECTSTRPVEDTPVSDEAGELVQNFSAISLKLKGSMKEYWAVRLVHLTQSFQFHRHHR